MIFDVDDIIRRPNGKHYLEIVKINEDGTVSARYFHKKKFGYVREPMSNFVRTGLRNEKSIRKNTEMDLVIPPRRKEEPKTESVFCTALSESGQVFQASYVGKTREGKIVVRREPSGELCYATTVSYFDTVSFQAVDTATGKQKSFMARNRWNLSVGDILTREEQNEVRYKVTEINTEVSPDAEFFSGYKISFIPI